MVRKSLSDILQADKRDSLSHAWDTTKAAEEFSPLPRGEYVAKIVAGELFTSKAKGTPGYRVTFKIFEGEHAGRHRWYEIWLTEAALAMAKRDLEKLGVTALDQLNQPMPQGIICRIKLTLQRDDDGTEFNRVKSFEVLRIDAPEADAFAPAETSEHRQGAAGGAG